MAANDNYEVTDLALAKFGPHGSHPLGGCTQALIHYANGYTVSVVSCRLMYSDGHLNYEVATGRMFGDKIDVQAIKGVETAPDGVAGYRTLNEVNDILVAVKGARNA